MIIYVLSASGKPLMPSKRERHIKKLLDQGKARIVSKVPYVVQLKYETTGSVQPLYGGIDPGRTNIGLSVIDQKGNVLYKAHVTTRNKDVPKLMAERKAHRQASRRGERLRRKRRARKCGTTKDFPNGRVLPGCDEPITLKDIINTEARFNNRKREPGWITPTVRQLVQTHISAVKKVCSILPVAKWGLEYNRFAFMKMDDGSIKGADFQNGRMKGYKDSYEYIHAMQDGKCACCGGKLEHYHHITERSKGGSDTPENLIGLCNACHDKVHKGELVLEKIGLKKKYAALSVLNQAMPRIAEGLIQLFDAGSMKSTASSDDNVRLCLGWETSMAREGAGIKKDHPEDAVCIAALEFKINDIKDDQTAFEIKQFRRHDRQRIKAQKERAYKLPDENGKLQTVCKNRHKRIGQGDIDSVEEFRKAHPSDVGRLTVVKSKRVYNRLDREMPGALFIYKGKEYVLKGQKNNGESYLAEGLPKNGVSSKKCQIIRHNSGLVYMH